MVLSLCDNIKDNILTVSYGIISLHDCIISRSISNFLYHTISHPNIIGSHNILYIISLWYCIIKTYIALDNIYYTIYVVYCIISQHMYQIIYYITWYGSNAVISQHVLHIMYMMVMMEIYINTILNHVLLTEDTLRRIRQSRSTNCTSSFVAQTT